MSDLLKATKKLSSAQIPEPAPPLLPETASLKQDRAQLSSRRGIEKTLPRVSSPISPVMLANSLHVMFLIYKNSDNHMNNQGY